MRRTISEGASWIFIKFTSDRISSALKRSQAEVFNFFADYNNFNKLFPFQVTKIKDGTSANGYGEGSVRKITSMGFISFEETIMLFEPNSRIEYKITRGGPLKNHYGIMKFEDQNGHCHLDYQISFESKFPAPNFLLFLMIEKPLRDGVLKAASILG